VWGSWSHTTVTLSCKQLWSFIPRWFTKIITFYICHGGLGSTALEDTVKTKTSPKLQTTWWECRNPFPTPVKTEIPPHTVEKNMVKVYTAASSTYRLRMARTTGGKNMRLLRQSKSVDSSWNPYVSASALSVQPQPRHPAVGEGTGWRKTEGNHGFSKYLCPPQSLARPPLWSPGSPARPLPRQPTHQLCTRRPHTDSCAYAAACTVHRVRSRPRTGTGRCAAALRPLRCGTA
jgi:hypothetical protein